MLMYDKLYVFSVAFCLQDTQVRNARLATKMLQSYLNKEKLKYVQRNFGSCLRASNIIG